MAIIGYLWSIIVDEDVRLNLRKDFSLSLFLDSFGGTGPLYECGGWCSPGYGVIWRTKVSTSCGGGGMGGLEGGGCVVIHVTSTLATTDFGG